MTGTVDEFPDFFPKPPEEQHEYLEPEKHMHSIWVVLIEAFLNYAASNSAESQTIFKLGFFHGSEVTEIHNLACVSQNVKLVYSEAQMYAATF